MKQWYTLYVLLCTYGSQLISQNAPSAPFTNMVELKSTAWISHYIHYKMWDKITYPFPNFNGAPVEVWEWISDCIPHFTVEVWEWISDCIPHFTWHMITCPCWLNHVIKRDPWYHARMGKQPRVYCMHFIENLPYSNATLMYFQWLQYEYITS